MARLNWHYFGDIISVLYGSQGPYLTSTECIDDGAIDSFVAQAAGNGGGSVAVGEGQHPAIRFVRRTVRTAEARGRRKNRGGVYMWKSGPLGPRVEVRKFPEALPAIGGRQTEVKSGEFVVGPTRIVLPYPFGRSGSPKIEAPPPLDDYVPEREVLGSRVLAAADALVMGKAGPEVDSGDAPEDVRQRLIEVARAKFGEPFDLPTTVEVTATNAPTYETAVEFVNDKVRLLLGTTQGPKATPGLFDDWPCGAFGSST